MNTSGLKAKKPAEKRPPRLARSLVEAAGMLRGKLPDGVTYQRKVRKEWAKRTRSR